jgi:hypothetical protein
VNISERIFCATVLVQCAHEEALLGPVKAVEYFGHHFMTVVAACLPKRLHEFRAQCLFDFDQYVFFCWTYC